MNEEEMSKLISQIDLFANLNVDTLKQIVEAAHYRQIAQHELLIREHTSTKSIFILVHGEFAVYKSDDQHGEFQLAILHPYNVVGELAFIDDLPVQRM